MSKALVINGANFTDNALTTITLISTAPCTGITLSAATAAITDIGNTATLTATLTPVDTTDTVYWSSSDETVATVSGGVVTSAGVGTATITATCGSYNATCTVTVRAFLNSMATAKIVGANTSGDSAVSGGNGLAYLDAVANRGTMLSATGTLHLYRAYENVHYYPFVMPQNTARIKVTYTDISSVYISGGVFWFNSSTAASGFSEVMKLIGKTPNTDLTPASGNDSVTIDIPTFTDYPSIDALLVPLRVASSAGTFTADDFAKVTFEFLPAE